MGGLDCPSGNTLCWLAIFRTCLQHGVFGGQSCGMEHCECFVAVPMGSPVLLWNSCFAIF